MSGWIKSHSIVANLLLALGYWGFAEIGFQLANVHDNVSPIWPASGLALAAVLMGGKRLLPGIFIGAFLANALTGISPPSALCIATGNMTEALAALFILHAILPFKTQLGRYGIPCWLLLSSLIAPIPSATLGSFSICYLNPSGPSAFGDIWRTWWAGDAIGALIVVPAILTFSRPKFNSVWLAKAGLLCILCSVTYTLIFFHDLGPPLLFLALPLLLLACSWFGPAGCAWATIGLVAFATLAALAGNTAAEGTALNNRILNLDIFLFALAITTLMISTFHQKGRFLIPATLFLAGWSVSGVVYYTLRKANLELDETHFQQFVEDAESSVRQKLDLYIDALKFSSVLYLNLNPDGTRNLQWRTDVDLEQLHHIYPGVNGIGFIRPFTADAIDAYVEQTRTEGLPEFTIRNVPEAITPPPDELGLTDYIITHIEPLQNNLNSLGLNVASESHRQEAARRARDSGQATMTARIQLVQDQQQRPGFLIYNPIYQPDMPTRTVAERRAAFLGWSYAPCITEVFFQEILRQQSDQISFEIYDDAQISPNSFVYASTHSAHNSGSDFDYHSTLNLAGQTFSFGWRRGPAFKPEGNASATVSAASLALGSCLLVGMIGSLQNSSRRANRIAEEKNAQLKEANANLQREVFERKRAEFEAENACLQAKEANMAKSSFLATMSHEIRTPMNSVLGFAELLADSELNADQRTWTSYIQSSGQSLLRIINDILDFSKIEAGKLELELIPFSIVDTIHEVVESFTTTAAQKGLVVTSRIDPNAPAMVIGDPIRLRQILTNLVANALKFTDKGEITIRLEWAGSAERGSAHIHVTDTGIGIPEEKVDHLFKEFTQADSSTTRQFGGTGLGLAICKKLVELMKGRIWAQSRLGQGTTISLKIPFTAKTAPPPAPLSHEKTTRHNQEQAGYGLNVLLVDDNHVNQKLGQAVLKRLGCRPKLASNGLEALELIKEKRFDIIFLDVQMPVMDGFETTRRIRELEANGQLDQAQEQKPLSIIALTANAQEKDRKDCLECGMDNYVSKPCRIDNFRTAIEKHLQCGQYDQETYSRNLE